MSDTVKVFTKLSHNEHFATCRDFVESKAKKKKLDADSRKEDGEIKRLRSVLFTALRGAAAGRCGRFLLSIKPGRTNPGTLTLHDGRIVPISDLTDIAFTTPNGDYDVVKASDVSKWFGGYVVGADIEITETGE